MNERLTDTMPILTDGLIRVETEVKGIREGGFFTRGGKLYVKRKGQMVQQISDINAEIIDEQPVAWSGNMKVRRICFFGEG